MQVEASTRYEILLRCGDTVSSAVEPRTGSYRKCIHCDAKKAVVAVKDTFLAMPEFRSTQAQVTPSDATGATSYAYAYGYLDQSVTTALADLRKLCRGSETWARQSVADRIHQIEMQLADRQSEATRQLTGKLSERDASEIVAEFTARATIEP